jgi:hypothetical protein
VAHPAYGWQHQKVRIRLLRTQAGMPCPRCGLLMLGEADPDPRLRALDLGHTDPAAKRAGLPGDRLEHAFCNRSAGDGSRPPAAYVPEWSSTDW